jgi:hypothetical protein
MRKSRFILSIFLSSTLVCGCSGSFGDNRHNSGSASISRKPFRSQIERAFTPKKINKVAILPFESNRDQQLPNSVLRALSKRLGEKIELGTSISIANFESPERADLFVAESERLARPIIERAKFLGDKLEAQGVIFGVITRFEGDRRSASKADQSASAGFKIWLLDLESGKTVWTATFDRQQQALTDNLLNAPTAFKDGLRFKSRDQLFDQGFKSVADSLATLRTSAQVHHESNAAGSKR